jgi:hypothetical protein
VFDGALFAFDATEFTEKKLIVNISKCGNFSGMKG